MLKPANAHVKLLVNRSVIGGFNTHTYPPSGFYRVNYGIGPHSGSSIIGKCLFVISGFDFL